MVQDLALSIGVMHCVQEFLEHQWTLASGGMERKKVAELGVIFARGRFLSGPTRRGITASGPDGMSQTFGCNKCFINITCLCGDDSNKSLVNAII